MELKILQIASDRWTLCFSWYKNRKLKIKLLWVGACKRKKSEFLYRLFCPKETFLTACFISMYSVLTTLSEYTYFYILKKNYFIYFLLASKIVESLQCIFNGLYFMYSQKLPSQDCVIKLRDNRIFKALLWIKKSFKSIDFDLGKHALT